MEEERLVAIHEMLLKPTGAIDAIYTVVSVNCKLGLLLLPWPVVWPLYAVGSMTSV